MILRKPYAFLIKYFRIIHLAMFIAIIYISLKTFNVLSFFNEYISNNQVISTYEDISSKYVNSVFIIAVSLVIIISSIILYLMRHKKKPTLLYLFMVISYSILLFLLLYTSSFIYNLTFETPDLRFTKIVRDLYLIEFIIQIPFLLILLVRTVGFDIKKFDFRKDLMELDISDDDNAEFEFQINLDTEDIRAKARKKIRYFKYYYKENKIVVFSILIIIFLFFSILVTKKILSTDKIYNEKDTFKTQYFDITVLDSYKTFEDYKGNIINNNKFYVILKLRYKNKSNNNLQINLDNSRLSYTEYNNVPPTTLMYNKFPEFGVPYYSQIIKAGETRDFVFVYEIDKNYYDNNLKLKYLYDIKNVNNQQDYKYRIVELNPKEFNENIKIIETKKLGEELTFTNSLLGNTKITINNMDLNNKYIYNIIRCKNNVCDKSEKFLTASTNSVYELTLMRLNYSITYDNIIWNDFSISEFIEKFGSIRFVINGKEYESKINLNDITPYETDTYVFLEVRERLNKAEKIYLDFTIRDNKYIYIIKDETKEENNK